MSRVPGPTLNELKTGCRQYWCPLWIKPVCSCVDISIHGNVFFLFFPFRNFSSGHKEENSVFQQCEVSLKAKMSPSAFLNFLWVLKKKKKCCLICSQVFWHCTVALRWTAGCSVRVQHRVGSSKKVLVLGDAKADDWNIFVYIYFYMFIYTYLHVYAYIVL